MLSQPVAFVICTARNHAESADFFILGGIDLGFKFSAVEPGSNLIILASNDDGRLELKGNLIKHVRENIAIISIDSETGQRFNFNNVNIEIEYLPPEGVPLLWRNAQIVTVQSQYVLQVVGDATRNNRRGCFRVGVSKVARLRMKGKGEREALVRDVSLSGFGLTDRRKELMLKMGDDVIVNFDDIGHSLNLAGKVVRIDETEEFISYGLSITNMCKDLSSYISVKQRQHRAQQ